MFHQQEHIVGDAPVDDTPRDRALKLERVAVRARTEVDNAKRARERR
jgi:hypothetical protein